MKHIRHNNNNNDKKANENRLALSRHKDNWTKRGLSDQRRKIFN